MASRTRIFAFVLLVALFAAACGGSDESGDAERAEPEGGGSSADASEEFNQPFGDVQAYPVFVSSELTVGPNRFLIGLLDDNDAPIGDPSIDVSVSFYDLDQSATDPVETQEMDFIWAVKNQRGLYVTQISFDRPGKWGAEVEMTGGGLDESVKGNFTVQETSSTPALGAKVPASKTPTSDDVKKLSTISTDPQPDPDLYRMSIAEAVAANKPFVLTFATPKFCASAVCGPTLDIVKSVKPDFPGVNFLHVEVYTNLDEPSNLEPVPSTQDWGLPSEPWVFVVDSSGKLAAKYEGVLGAGELRTELNRLTS